MKPYHYFFLLIIFFNYSCQRLPQNAIVLFDTAENVNFDQLKTFAWLPPDETIEDLAIISVEDQLNRRGFVRDIETPDILVMVVINNPSEEPVRTPFYNHFEYLGPGFYSGPFQNYYYTERITVPIFSGYGIEQRDFTTGTVVVDIIKTEKMEIIWRGLAVDQRHNPIDVLNDLPAYINSIFEDFPVPPDS
ncbi:hypothetical protein BH23BAC1_BH23BAC1_39970 [soil metagenome]